MNLRNSILFSIFAPISVICLAFVTPSIAKDEKPAAKKEKSADAKKSINPKIIIKTNKGEIEAELDNEKAPISVKNFLEYVEKKQYDGTIFHRVIPGFMIQGGGFDKNMNEKSTSGAGIKNEAGNGLKNLEGTLAMARTSDVNSAKAQFFINLKDNGFLDHRDDSMSGFGYAVFGKVTKGMEIAHQIEKVTTKSHGMYDDVPAEAIVIESIRKMK